MGEWAKNWSANCSLKSVSGRCGTAFPPERARSRASPAAPFGHADAIDGLTHRRLCRFSQALPREMRKGVERLSAAMECGSKAATKRCHGCHLETTFGVASDTLPANA